MEVGRVGEALKEDREIAIEEQGGLTLSEVLEAVPIPHLANFLTALFLPVG